MPKRRKREDSMISAVLSQRKATITCTVPICRLDGTKYSYVTTDAARRAVRGMARIMARLITGCIVDRAALMTLKTSNGLAGNVTVGTTSGPCGRPKLTRLQAAWKREIARSTKA
jgi:hypothetical protein